MKEHWTARHSIDPVAHYATSKCRSRVRADLVRAAGQGLELNQARAIAHGKTAPARHRAASQAIGDHFPSGLGARFLLQSKRNDPFLVGNFTGNHREIVFLNGMRFESLLIGRASLGRACEQQAPAGVHVEPMHRGRRPFKSALQLAKSGSNGLASTPRRIDRQTGWLVEDKGLSVDEQDAFLKVHGSQMWPQPHLRNRPLWTNL